ncbi:MAG: T9SS type A sorting domain-containing protein, partial [Bacteroidales bacterium]
NESVTIHTEGTASPGMYTYHSGRPLSTCDADHDGSGSGNCATNYNCAAWWYGSCWSGSFWGGGGTVSQDAPYWEASVAEYFEYGSIWIRGTWTPELSSLTINSVTDADCRGATVHGTITDPGSPNPTAYGVCWNTTGTPDTTDSHTNEGSASAPGDFTSTLPDILPSTTYYLRAYATNFAGISYSPEVSVATAADDTGPTLYCNDTTIYFDADGSYTIDTSHIFSGIYDYCGVDTLYVVNGNLTCDGYSLYPRTVSIYAKDVSGNMDSCQATVTMVDTIRPVIECLSDQVRDAGVSNTYLVSGEEFAPALAEDNCYFTLTNNLNGSNSLAGLFLPTGSNRIQWTITDRFGNADSCSFIVEVNEYVSGMVTTNAEKPAIYPNPAAETVTIEYYRTTGTCKIEVLNIIGLVLYSTETKEKKTTIDLSGFPAGVYHIRISANDQETSTRLIKR